MSVNEDLISAAIERGSILIRCLDKKDADSKRVSLYHTRAKMAPILKDQIGIALVRKGEEIFVKIWIRKDFEVYEENELGELVPVIVPDKATDRLIEKMREDGLTDEQIKEYFSTEKGEKDEV